MDEVEHNDGVPPNRRIPGHNHNDISGSQFHILMIDGVSYVANNQGVIFCTHLDNQVEVVLMWGAKAIICGTCGHQMYHVLSPGAGE